MAQHTAKQWRELVKKLIAMRDDPNETREHRQKAEQILFSVRSNPEAQQALRDEVPVSWGEII